MKQIFKLLLSASTTSIITLNSAHANSLNIDFNEAVQMIEEQKTNINLDIANLQNKLEDLTRAFNIMSTQKESPKIPAVTVVAFAGENVPKGWLLCDGAVIIPFPVRNFTS
jgi:hypothetical protein